MQAEDYYFDSQVYPPIRADSGISHISYYSMDSDYGRNLSNDCRGSYQKEFWNLNNSAFEHVNRSNKSVDPGDESSPQTRDSPRSIEAPITGTGDGPTSEDAKKKKRRKKKKKDDADGKLENPENLRCYNCDQMGHLSRDCQVPRSCFLCGDKGHVAKQCKYSALVTVEPHESNTNDDIDTEGAVVEEDATKANICLNCNEAGHRLKNCPYGRKCFQCGHVGHVARECPNVSERVRMLQKLGEIKPQEVDLVVPTKIAATELPPAMLDTPEPLRRVRSSSPLFLESGAFSGFHPLTDPSESPSSFGFSHGHDNDFLKESDMHDMVSHLLSNLDVTSDE